MSRPVPEWNGFIGQRQCVALAKKMAEGVGHEMLFPNAVFMGPSGTGKTELARTIARAVNRPFHAYICHPDWRMNDLEEKSASWQHGDLVFLDEVHALPRKVQELLYQIIDIGVLHQSDANGASREPNGAVKVSILAATDQPGSLLGAFKRRMTLNFEMRPYSVKELIAIARTQASSLNIILTPQATRALAITCRGIPRLVRHRLEALTIMYAQEGLKEFDVAHVRRCLRHLGIDPEYGLSRLDRAYLKALSDSPDGLPLYVIAAKTTADKRTLTADVEPFLFHLELITAKANRRALTQKGIDYISNAERYS